MRKERRRRKKAHPKRAPVFRSPNPLQDPCNLRLSLFLSLKTLKLKLMEKIECKNGSVLVLIMSRCIRNIRQSSRKNGWKTKSCTRNEEKPSSRGARPCVSRARPCVPPHHGPWCSPRADRGGLCPSWSAASRTLHFGFLGASIWAAKFAYVGRFWASSAIFFDPQALNFTLSPITWLISHESAIKTRKTRNKRNWRNRGVNHINIH